MDCLNMSERRREDLTARFSRSKAPGQTIGPDDPETGWPHASWPETRWQEAVAGRLRAESRVRESERRVQELSAELDAARAAAKAGALVVAKASHELRTPLNGIIGLSEILRHKAAAGLGAPEAARLAGDIHESGVHLLNLVEVLLDFSRLDVTDRGTPRRIAIRAEIDCALSALGPVAERKGIVVENACEPAVEWMADRRVFRQVAINLASNAVKFSPPGSRIRIAASITADALALHVGDQGPGVAEDERERILRPFDRGRDAERDGIDGVGLGLAIVAELLMRQDGRLVIEPAEGGGSVFTAVFPAARG
jgi:two-component system, cell cycle sensor histidine kinase PleC